MPDNDVPTTYYVLPYTNYYSNPISRYIDTMILTKSSKSVPMWGLFLMNIVIIRKP